MPRWMPLQRMHTKTPMFHEAQRGCLLRLQSAQDLFDSSFTSCLSVALFCSVRSGPEGTRRDMMGYYAYSLAGGMNSPASTKETVISVVQKAGEARFVAAFNSVYSWKAGA